MLTPYMPKFEIAMMDAVFALKRPMRVLEFGAGGSTVRWSKGSSIDSWLSVEHDSKWYERVSTVTSANVHLRMAASDSAQSYMKLITNRGGQFDLIFVDGLYRVECVKASPQWLAPHGVVILHDAIRTEYAGAWDVYPHRAMLTRGECVRRGQLKLEHDGCRNGLMLMWGGV